MKKIEKEFFSLNDPKAFQQLDIPTKIVKMKSFIQNLIKQ